MGHERNCKKVRNVLHHQKPLLRNGKLYLAGGRGVPKNLARLYGRYRRWWLNVLATVVR